MTCFNCGATDVRMLYAAAQTLERTSPLSAKKKEIGEPNWYSTSGTLTEQLSILCSGFCRRCSSGRALAAKTTRENVPMNFVLSFSRTAEAWCRFGAAGYSQLDPVCDRWKCGGANCLKLSNSPVCNRGEVHELEIAAFRFVQPDVQTAQTCDDKGPNFAAWRPHCGRVLSRWQ